MHLRKGFPPRIWVFFGSLAHYSRAWWLNCPCTTQSLKCWCWNLWGLHSWDTVYRRLHTCLYNNGQPHVLKPGWGVKPVKNRPQLAADECFCMAHLLDKGPSKQHFFSHFLAGFILSKSDKWYVFASGKWVWRFFMETVVSVLDGWHWDQPVHGGIVYYKQNRAEDV